MSRGRIAGLALVGTAAGAFSGLFGVGGGAVIVPLLIGLLGYGERRATGTSLAAIVLIAMFAATASGGLYGNVDLQVGLILALPAVVGVVVGTAVQQRLPERSISVIFSVILVAVAVDMVAGSPSGSGGDHTTLDLVFAGAICFAGGVVGGLVGVGGGAIFVPAMTVFIGLGQVQAEATSLLMIAFVSVFGTWRHVRYGNVDLRDAAIVGLLSAPGVVAGVLLANSTPERTLRIGFGLLALFMAWRLIRRVIRDGLGDEAGGRKAMRPQTRDRRAP